MWSRALLVVSLLAGCDGVFRLTHIPASGDAVATSDVVIAGDAAATVDATVHAGSLCSDRPTPPAYCADFDETPAVVYAGGTTAPIPTGVPGVLGITVVAGPPSTTGPAALHFASLGSASWTGYKSNHPYTQLDATFAFLVEGTSSTGGMTSVFEMDMSASASPCTTSLVIDEAGSLLVLAVDCGLSSSKAFLTPLPSTWISIEYIIDIQAGLVSVSTGAMTQTIAIPTSAAVKPTLDLGIESAGLDGLGIAFDDIAVIGTS